MMVWFARMDALHASRRRSDVGRCVAAAVLLCCSFDASHADEPKGCEAFKWPLAREAFLLQTPNPSEMPMDGTATIDGKAHDLKLVAFGEAHLPMAPERKPRSEASTAGFARFAAPAVGSYQVTISRAAWIDVVQDGHYVKPSAFSGATDCPGVRKSIRVDLAATPFTLQISGAGAASIGLIVEPTPR